MVKVGLQINAQLENIEELKTNHPDYTFYFKIICSNCGTESEKWHDITESEGEFSMKCPQCKRVNSIDIVKNSNASYRMDDVGKFKTIVTLDCRGVEPSQFAPKDFWIAKSVDNGQVFDNVDLSDDWFDYDDKNKVAVGISEFQTKFIRIKK